MDKKIDTIVLTGGTESLRNDAAAAVRRHYMDRGYTVFVIPSAKEELERAGVMPGLLGAEAFAEMCLAYQLMVEDVIMSSADIAREPKILIVCCEGAPDAFAGLEEAEQTTVLRSCGVSRTALRDNYDAVFILPAEENSAASPAASAWAGHPHVRLPETQEMLISDIADFFGDPVPEEIERKYLIEYPDLAWLDAQPGCRPVEIEQAYLENAAGEAIRVRRRGSKDGYIYFETIKRGGAGIRRFETERRLTKDEYEKVLAEAKGEVLWIRKTRYCLVYKGQYLEIDVYPFWNTKAVLEAELRDEDDAVEIPPEIRVIADVTGDPDYTNYALARPDEH